MKAKWSTEALQNFLSENTTSWGKRPAATGKPGRPRWGEAPRAANRLFTRDRWSISSKATRRSPLRQPSMDWS